MSCPDWHNDYFGDCGGCVIDTAKTQERERIIKLLESDPENWITLGGGAGAGYEAAIALIKGENK